MTLADASMPPGEELKIGDHCHRIVTRALVLEVLGIEQHYSKMVPNGARAKEMVDVVLKQANDKKRYYAWLDEHLLSWSQPYPHPNPALGTTHGSMSTCGST